MGEWPVPVPAPPEEFTRWIDLTDDPSSQAGSNDAILREQALYEAWALRADLDGVCVLCAVQPRAKGSRYCERHQVDPESA